MERNPVMASVKVEPESSLSEKVAQVLQLVQREGPLSKKQAEFCDEDCVERYLKARGNNVRRAARLLKATLNWREKINIGYLIADEFPAELATGTAYVAGLDDDGRPVLVIKKKPDQLINHRHKQYLLNIVFTMEVAVAAMPPGVTQWVLILDARGYSRVSAPSPSGILMTLKILADHYPERLAKAFIVDASSMFYYVWKGVCTFVDPATRGKLSFVYLKDYREDLQASPCPKAPLQSSSYPLISRRHSISELPNSVNKHTSQGIDEAPLPPGLHELSPQKNDKNLSLVDGPELISSVPTSRSFSFSSVVLTPSSPDAREGESSSFRKYLPFVSNSGVLGSTKLATKRRHHTPSWDGLVSLFSSQKKKKDTSLQEEQRHKTLSVFRPYVKFIQAPYNEAAYRAIMKPPLGGLVSLLSKDLKRQSSF